MEDKNISDIMLTDSEIDVIGEILNISMGSAATAVSSMLDKQVTITTPSIIQEKFKNVDCSEMEPALVVKIKYIEGIMGSNIIMFRKHDMQIILNLLMGNDEPTELDADFEFDEMSMSAACEVMNQMMGASATALSEILGMPVNISTPQATLAESSESIYQSFDDVTDEDQVAVISFKMMIKDVMDSSFRCYLRTSLVHEIVNRVTGESDPEPMQPETPEIPQMEPTPPPAEPPVQPEMQPSVPPATPAAPPQAAPAAPAASQMPPAGQPAANMQQPAAAPAMNGMQPPTGTPQAGMPQQPAGMPQQPAGVPQQPLMNGMDPMMQQQMMAAMQGMMSGMYGMQPPMMNMYGMPQQQMPPQYGAQPAPQAPQQKSQPSAPQVNVKKAQFPDFNSQNAVGDSMGNQNMSLLMGVPLEVSVVIGKTRKKIKDIMEFGQGTVVELDKQTGAPAEVLVNGQLLAYADVVVIGDNFGIRITEIVGTKDLIDSLNAGL